MGIETGDTIATLNEAWPAGGEPHAQGDDHIRQIKHVLLLDALSKADGGEIIGPVSLPSGATVGGQPIATTTALAGKANVVHSHAQVDITNLTADLATKAPLDSPQLVGVPIAPTAAPATNSTQIATTAFVTAAVAVGGGGGGGGGDDLDTTPVAAAGSSLLRTMPEWLAGAPIIEIAADAVIVPNHRGAWLHMMNAIGSSIFLPDDWSVGMSFGVRQIGTGPVTWWTTGSSATVQLPFTRNTHTGISEQYEEIVFRVIANSDGAHAVWGISGATG